MLDYYDRRAPEYDDWWNGTGLFAARERPGWHDEVEELIEALHALPPARTLDVACGTAFLGRHLPGDVTGLDASPAMRTIARERLAEVVAGDALDPPFPDGAFERVATGHFYGHLEESERFLVQARRLAPELLVIDSARRDDVPPERMDPRVLRDGSRHEVYKRWFEPAELVAELGGGDVRARRSLVRGGEAEVVLTARRQNYASGRGSRGAGSRGPVSDWVIGSASARRSRAGSRRRTSRRARRSHPVRPAGPRWR